MNQASKFSGTLGYQGLAEPDNPFWWRLLKAELQKQNENQLNRYEHIYSWEGDAGEP
jgi:hypothetical protein